MYDLAASRYVEFVGTEIGPATEAALDESLLMAFIELVQAGPPGVVADLGCGPGRVAAFLAQHACEVFGLDVSQGMVTAAQHAHPGIHFGLGELAALPIENDVLAGAVCWYSIIYTPPDGIVQVVDEIARVLRSDGYLLLGFQAGDDEAVHRQEAHGTTLPLTNYLHSPPTIATHLEEAGFSIHTNVVRPAELEHETTQQCLVIARRLA